MATDVPRDFAAPRRVTDVNRVLQVERLDQRREVVRVRVHIVSVPRLARAPVPAAIVGDATVPARSEEHHLVFERIRIERPTVTEDDGLARSPVLIVNLGIVTSLERSHAVVSSAACRILCDRASRRAPAGKARIRGRIEPAGDRGAFFAARCANALLYSSETS